MLDDIKNLIINPHQTVYIDCPYCGGVRKMGVTNMNGTYVYGCFRDSCKRHGVIGKKRSKEDIKNIIHQDNPDIIKPFIIPETFKRIKGTDQIVDIAKNRKVYLIDDLEGNTVGAVGRTKEGNRVKWLRYGTFNAPYRTKPLRSACVVTEDVLSARYVAEIDDRFSGLALLGTNFQSSYLPYLKDYGNFIIALDPDARKSAIKVARRISGLTAKKVRIMSLDKDPKDMDKDELKRRLNSAS